MLRSSSSFIASVTAAALSFGLLAATPGLAEASAPTDKTTFLGLEGEDEHATTLADAIRWDLNQRGLDDGNTMSLAELKLTMGCGDDDLACFAQGGETLGSSELVFGNFVKIGDNYFVELKSLNVETSELNKKIERTISFLELSEAELGKTASSLINELYDIESEPDVEPETGPTEGPEVEPEQDPQKEGSLVWGPYSPRPVWKYVGVGVSGGLLLAGLGTAIGATVAISDDGPIHKDLIAAAEASLVDGKPGNDVDPNGSGDLCALAQTPPDANKPLEVTNAAVTEVCIKADDMATVATVGWIATGVFAVSTALFTTLLFVHKKDPAVAKLREHKVGFGGAPTPSGGFMLGGSFEF